MPVHVPAAANLRELLDGRLRDAVHEEDQADADGHADAVGGAEPGRAHEAHDPDNLWAERAEEPIVSDFCWGLRAVERFGSVFRCLGGVCVCAGWL